MMMSRRTHTGWRVMRGLPTALAVAVAPFVSGARTSWSPPLHTTRPGIALGSADGRMRLTIRAFADDFSAAVAKHAGKPRPADYRVPDADILSYIASVVA